MSSLTKRLLLIPFGTLLGLALCTSGWLAWRWAHPAGRPLDDSAQTALRAKLDANPQAIFQFDPELSYQFKKNHRGQRHATDGNLPHQTNELGLLGYDMPTLDGSRREVLILGDSVTYGNGVPEEDVFVSHWQRHLGPGYRLWNAGCPGWSTHQERRYLERDLSAVPWHTVVLVVCLNDLIRYEWVYQGDDDYQMSPDIAEVGGFWQTNQSAAGLRLWLLRRKFEGLPATQPLAAMHNGLLWSWDETNWQAYVQRDLTPLSAGKFGRRLVVAVVPLRAQLAALAAGAPQAEVLQPQQRFVTFCETRDLPYLDGLPRLRQASEQLGLEQLYLDPVHLSPAGHRVWADALAAELRAALDSRPAATAPVPRLAQEPPPIPKR